MEQSKKPKWTGAQVKEHIQKIMEVVKQQKKENKEENFTGITADELEKKFKRANSPMIVSQGWNSTSPGGTINYNLGIYNPDPTDTIWLFAHVWVGSGNVVPDPGTFLLNVDTRFPRITLPKFDGLRIPSGTSSTLNFSFTVPANVEKTNYLGNSCLMNFNWHDVGTYLDRGIFVFAVS